jgi:signal transduction histidine kinase
LSDRKTVSLVRRFGDLRIRPKLIVLHNLFFLILTIGVYFTLIPSFERRVERAKTIEISLITEIFAGDKPPLQLPKIESYDYREGSAETLQIPRDVRKWLDAHPGEVWRGSAVLFRKDPHTWIYRRITLPNLVYDEVVERAKIALFVVLGFVYVLAVLALELVIMPAYVYQPIRLMLDADDATRQGDRGHELIDEELISGDEIGQIMRSRNQTVTELRDQEDNLAQALKRLEAQDRLASLGMLSASVAHEMNTPLSVLHGSTEKLLETVHNPPAQERLKRMLRVTQRLKKISEGLVDFARVRRQTMEPVALKPLIDEAWSLVAIDEKAAGIDFSAAVPDEARVIGNGDRLVQVFVNLLRNALIAVDRGGSIRVRTQRSVREGQAVWCIAIEDDGPGIPADVLPEIFNAFVSSRLDSRGTGLGLTVAQGIVDQHGGTISASNREGGGAKLEVVLRAAELQAP